MKEDVAEFTEALLLYVSCQIGEGYDLTYNRTVIKIIDARNHLFQEIGEGTTDESEDIYALADLCYLDDDMNLVPNRERITRIARNYWG